MATYTFLKESNQITINDFVDINPGTYKVVADALNNKVVILNDAIDIRLEIDLDEDTVTINGDAFSGNATQLKTALYADVFTEPAGGVVTVYQRKTILTDAQIKALPTTYVELVPAMGAGKILLFHSAFIINKTSGGVYTNLDTPGFAIVFGSAWDGNASQDIPLGGSFLGNTDSYSAWALPASNVAFSMTTPWGAFPLSTYENNGLYFAGYNNTGNWTGGNAANTLEVTVFYSIVDL